MHKIGPLTLSNLLRDAFLAGRGVTGKLSPDDQKAWAQYDIDTPDAQWKPVQEILDEYRTTWRDAPHGWIGFVIPTEEWAWKPNREDLEHELIDDVRPATLAEKTMILRTYSDKERVQKEVAESVFKKLADAVADKVVTQALSAVVKDQIRFDVCEYKKSDGASDWYVMMRCMDRELSLLKLPYEYQARYHAAELKWLVFGGDKPDILAFND